MSIIRKSILTICLLGICFIAQGKEKPTSVLFVGNSYTFYNDMPQIVRTMAEAKGVELKVQKSTAGGATLEQHFKGEKKLQTMATIAKGDFDFVIMQEQSMMPAINPPKTLEFAARICTEIKKTKATPAFFLTWARENDPPMQEKLNATYFKAAKENDATVIPVGLAWQMARKKHPKIKLFAKDGSHPSPIGSYLSACVFLATLTGKDPVGLPIKLGTIITVDPKKATLMQQVARETIEKFKASKAEKEQ